MLSGNLTCNFTDTYDAMASKRHIENFFCKVTLKELENSSGIQSDESVVRLFEVRATRE